jgi:hypothetical protein
MYFSVSLAGDGYIKIKTAAPEPLKMRPHTFYTAATSAADLSADPKEVEFILEEARTLYGARRAIRLQNGTILLCTPTRGLRALCQIPTSHFWPYPRLVDAENRSYISVSTPPTEAYDRGLGEYVVTGPKWTIEKYLPRVLFWGVYIDYVSPRPELAGIYYGSGEECIFFPKATLISGIQAFLERAAESDVLMTNSSHDLKLYLLEEYATRAGVRWIMPPGLLTSVEAILSVAVPGLNWDFPDAVENWARRQHGGVPILDSRGAFIKLWSTDYAALPIEVGTGAPAGLMAFFKKKIHASAYVSLPLLAAKMQIAIELGVDLRCVLDPTELGCALKAIHGAEIGRSPATVISKDVMAGLPGPMSIARLEAGDDQIFYVYDARSYMAKRTATYGLPAAAIDSSVRVHDMEKALIDMGNNFVLMYEYGVILLTRLEGVEPLFVFSSLFVSRRGVYGQGVGADGEFYGYGAIGREGSQTRALERKFLYNLSGDNRPMKPLNEDVAAYSLLATPTNPELYRSLCTPPQYAALTESKIPIPLTVWMSPDGTLAPVYDRRVHSAYHGNAFPVVR